ncbi:MAG TPA: spore coat U domain-containing protein [Gammaproteobacteria bacterium]|nr:spore coat U domain-containing protein [Gammaproteobacteria bacterium]
MNKRLLKVVIAGALVAPTAALAGTTAGSLTVSASVNQSCQVGTSAIDFGPINTLATSDTTAQGNVNVQCTSGTVYTIGLDKGTNGVDTSNRKMLNSVDGVTLMNYALYYDSAHANNWGNTFGTDTPASKTADGTMQSTPVYGVVPTGQSALTAGSYSDTVTVTVSY